MKDYIEAIYQSTVLLHILLGMSLATAIQFYKIKYKNLKWTERFVSSIASSFFVVAFSLPLLDFYPQLPPSIALLIGGFCGSFGTAGIQDLFQRVLDRFLPRATPLDSYEKAMLDKHMSLKNDVVLKESTNQAAPFKTIKDEPPMPDDMRDKR